MSAMARQRGFTLPEMIIILFIVGLLAAMGLPAMTKLLTTQAVRSASYDLFADLVFARSEAIARGSKVRIVGVDSTDFKKGWTILEDAGGTTIRTQPARDAAIVFTSTQGTIVFDRTGRAESPAEIAFSIAPVETPAQDSMKRCIRLDPSGRPRSSEGACT